jgi:bacillithiol biosynthesis cysteine-adding enzyme BshC
MDFSVSTIKYSETGYFSKIAIDYLNQADFLKDFYIHAPNTDGIKAAIKARQSFPTNRSLLVQELKDQYQGIDLTAKQEQNLLSLLDANSFTITTAHQPNIFTGPLYFIYKIFHVIKLAEEFNASLEGYHFVPVYYMGSEDADLDELGYINIDGKKLVWETSQTGAVGRMKVDKKLVQLIKEIYGQIGVLPFGNEMAGLLRSAYTIGKTIQQATLELVNSLFAEYGLMIVIPDNARLKKSFQPVIEKELKTQFSHHAVQETITSLSDHYKVQAGGRELNLFYLFEDKRERIELKNNLYTVQSLQLSWNLEGILQELELFPERFSANVILRGVFQETILPNILFVGGGGELAYWLELKKVFAAAEVPYPVLLLRNSFALVREQQEVIMEKFGFSKKDLFQPAVFLINELVKRESLLSLDLVEELNTAKLYYTALKAKAGRINASLGEHVSALETKAIKRLVELEKKMLRAEKRKFDVQQQQIIAFKKSVFPANSLQERTDNLSAWYARYGKGFMQMIHEASLGLEPDFIWITVKD